MPPLARFRDWRLGKKRRPAGAGGRNRIWRRTPHVRAAEHAGSRPRSLLPGHPADRDVAPPARGESFRTLVQRTTHSPLQASLVGLLFGGLMQSATAVTFILVGLASSGLITTSAALPIIVWCNVGLTALAFVTTLEHPPAGRLAGRRIRDRVGGAETRPAARRCRRPARDGAHPLRPGDDEPRRRAARDDAVVPADARDRPGASPGVVRRRDRGSRVAPVEHGRVDARHHARRRWPVPVARRSAAHLRQQPWRDRAAHDPGVRDARPLAAPRAHGGSLLPDQRGADARARPARIRGRSARAGRRERGDARRAAAARAGVPALESPAGAGAHAGARLVPSPARAPVSRPAERIAGRAALPHAPGPRGSGHRRPCCSSASWRG